MRLFFLIALLYKENNLLVTLAKLVWSLSLIFFFSPDFFSFFPFYIHFWGESVPNPLHFLSPHLSHPPLSPSSGLPSFFKVPLKLKLIFWRLAIVSFRYRDPLSPTSLPPPNSPLLEFGLIWSIFLRHGDGSGYSVTEGGMIRSTCAALIDITCSVWWLVMVQLEKLVHMPTLSLQILQ